MGAQRPSHHESREAVSGVQATSKVGIVIGFARFGTVPDAMIVIVLQLVTGLALNAVKKGGGRASVRSRRHADVIAEEGFAIAGHRPQPSGELVGHRHGGPVVATSFGDIQRRRAGSSPPERSRNLQEAMHLRDAHSTACGMPRAAMAGLSPPYKKH
jgi:hypothetical protein